MNKDLRLFELQCIAVQYYKFDLSKDFFTLSGEEICNLDRFRQAVRHPRWDNGKSPCREFWDYLRKDILPF